MSELTNQEIGELLASPREQLRGSLLEADLRECRLTDLSEIMLPFDEISEIYHQQGLVDFEDAITFSNSVLGDIATEHVSHYTGLSYVLAVYELIDELTDQLIEGTADFTTFHIFLEKIRTTFKGVENVTVALASPEQTILQDIPPNDIIEDGSVSDFINEVGDGLETVEEYLLTLEQDPTQGGLIDHIFRVMHTIKGTSGFLGMPTIGKVGHKTEDVLSEIRDGKRGLDPVVFELLFRSVDTLKNLIAQLTCMVRGEDVEPVNIGLFFKSLETVQSGVIPEPVVEPPVPAAEPVEAPTPQAPAAETEAAEEDMMDMEAAMAEEAAAEAIAHPERVAEPAKPAPAPVQQPVQNKPAGKPAGGSKPAGTIQEMLKVPAERLDDLSNLVGEMVVALSLLTQNPAVDEMVDRRVHSQLDHLEKITESLRDKVLGIRMFPIGSVFSKLSRQVRDLSQKSGKKINLELSGSDTLVDKSIIDNIYAPLMHLVRNSIDHGIEEPGERGEKEGAGLVALSAQHLGDAIEIEIRDDGKGLDAQTILAKAQERGLVKNRESLSNKDIFNFIFMPGFSTAKVVTDISGRGVGMDVVRRTIEGLRGKIATDSTPGEGTSFKLRLPLTTSIIEGLVVSVGESRFIMPILDVLQTITPEDQDLKGVQGKDSEFFLLAGEMVPIVRLYQLFGIEPKVKDPRQAVVVVVQVGSRPYGLLVDEMLHRQQIVIQQLGERLKGLKGLSGGTILGDGRVGLIIDPVSLIQEEHLHVGES